MDKRHSGKAEKITNTCEIICVDEQNAKRASLLSRFLLGFGNVFRMLKDANVCNSQESRSRDKLETDIKPLGCPVHGDVAEAIRCDRSNSVLNDTRAVVNAMLGAAMRRVQECVAEGSLVLVSKLCESTSSISADWTMRVIDRSKSDVNVHRIVLIR